MNKEEFKAKREIINSKMNELKNEMIKLEKEYIESNVKHPIGSKVCITTPASTYTKLDSLESVTVPERKQYAYIRDYKINFLDDIEPLCCMNCALEYVMSAHYKMSAMIVQKSFAI